MLGTKLGTADCFYEIDERTTPVRLCIKWLLSPYALAYTIWRCDSSHPVSASSSLLRLLIFMSHSQRQDRRQDTYIKRRHSLTPSNLAERIYQLLKDKAAKCPHPHLFKNLEPGRRKQNKMQTACAACRSITFYVQWPLHLPGEPKSEVCKEMKPALF